VEGAFHWKGGDTAFRGAAKNRVRALMRTRRTPFSNEKEKNGAPLFLPRRDWRHCLQLEREEELNIDFTFYSSGSELRGELDTEEKRVRGQLCQIEKEKNPTLPSLDLGEKKE